MVAKRPSKDDTAKIIGVDHFRGRKDIVDQDPLEPTPMRLDINHVDPYDRNPRRATNPLYDDIAESLKSSGQDEVLTVTRRPGASNYMIMRGGNTRLAIMKELFVQGDLRFAQIDCLFKPWTSDADCIVKHLTENTTQGEMTFIDKARGYRAFQREHEQQHGVALSQRQLAELLQEKGASVSQPRLSVMNYALEVLEPAMPIPLEEEGIGKSQVEKLQKLEHTFRHLAQSHNLYGNENFDARFAADWHHVLAQNNGINWVFEAPMLDVVAIFMDRVGAFRDRLMLDINDCMKARKPYEVDLFSTNLGPALSPPEHEGTTGDATKTVTHSPLLSSTSPTPPESTDESGETNTASDGIDATNELADGADALPAVVLTPSSPLNATPPSEPVNDISGMRSNLYNRAFEFGNATGCAQWVDRWDQGYGFFLQAPETALPQITGDMGDDHRPLLGWWSLWQHQGVMVPSVLSAQLDAMPDGTIKGTYQRFVETLNDGATSPTKASTSLYTALGGPMFLHVLAQADSVLGPQAMAMLATLISDKATMIATLAQQGIDVWTTA